MSDVDGVMIFYDQYKKYLRDYIFGGGEEEVLLSAFENLIQVSDPFLAEAINILDIHDRALEEVLEVKRETDCVQWMHVRRANEFLAQIFMTIDSQMLRLREQVEEDVLTSLYNRLSLSRVLTSLWMEFQRSPQDMILAMVDIDNFKRVNDTYGHPVGDEVLKEVARKLKSSVRDIDLVFRYGGEEFVVLLHGITYDLSHLPLERMRRNVERLVIGGHKVKVTISIGAASLEDRPKTVDELINYADLALYEAKARGKNTVVFFRDIREKVFGTGAS